MPLLDFFSNPNVALAAGLLSPTPNKSFGQGLLQGINAGQGATAANSVNQLRQLEAQMAEAAEARREAASGIVGDVASGTTPLRQGLMEAAAQSNNPAQTLVSAIQSSAFDAPEGSGFKGTGIGQFYNTFIDLQGKIDAGETLTPKEQLQFDSAKRELTSPKVVGTPETGFTAIPAQPLPGVSAEEDGSSFVDENRLLSRTERASQIDSEGNHPPIGSTLRDVTSEGSQYKSVTAAEAERIFAGKSATGIIETLEELSGINTDEPVFRDFDGLIERSFSSAKNYKEYLDGQNVDLVTYVDASNGVLALIVRAFGEKGTLATKDIDRLKSFVPRLFPVPDSPATAKKKFNSMKKLVNEINNRLESQTGTIDRSGETSESFSDDEILLLERYSQ